MVVLLVVVLFSIRVVTTKPSDFLKQVVGKRVVVKLNSGVEYHGKNPYVI